jgi:hypothetical protein
MNITTSGVTYFGESFRPGRKVLIDLAGTSVQFGSRTVTFGYKSADGEFSPFLKADGGAVTTTSRGGFECRVPRSGQVGVSLSGAPGTGGLTLDVIHAIDMPAGS